MTKAIEYPKRDEQGNAFLTTVNVKGREFPVYIDDSGRFTTHPNRGEIVDATSLDGLKKKLLRVVATAQENVSVPIWLWDGGRIDKWSVRTSNGPYGDKKRTGWSQAVVRGIHGGNDNALIQTPDGERDQYSAWRHGEAFRGDTPDAVRDRYEKIQRELTALYKEQEKIEDEWKVRPEQVAKEALEQVVG